MAVAAITKNFTGRDDNGAPAAGQVSWKLPFDGVLKFNKTDADATDITTTFTALVAGDEVIRDGNILTVVSVVNATPIFTVTTSATKAPTSKHKAPVGFRPTSVHNGVTKGPDDTQKLNTQYENWMIADNQARLNAGV